MEISYHLAEQGAIQNQPANGDPLPTFSIPYIFNEKEAIMIKETYPLGYRKGFLTDACRGFRAVRILGELSKVL